MTSTESTEKSPVPSLPESSNGGPGEPPNPPGPLSVPGYGKPVNATTPECDFKNVFDEDGWKSIGITIREKRMMVFVDSISDKPDWERKVFDESIVAKWRAEASIRQEIFKGDVMLSEKMFDFCMEELRDKAKIFKETGLVNVYDGEITLVKSDVAVSETLRKALCEDVKALEDVPDHMKDWHPRSNGLVLDLVHPSLFPVSYGLTKVVADKKVPLDDCLAYIGKGDTIKEFTASRHEESGPYEWGSFQWLPTDVELSVSGAKFGGYINNLHPKKHRSLYKTLEEIVTATVPLWQECLGGFGNRRRIELPFTGEEDWTYPEGLRYRIPDIPDGPKAWYDPIERTVDGEIFWDSPDGGDFKYTEEYELWDKEHRILKQREPRDYKPQANMTKPVNFGEQYPQGLQVIFKLANIQLTPEKPEYEGGSWHVEGANNESICASAIYYYDQQNITDSKLAFRQGIDSEELIQVPAQSEYASLEEYLGVEQDGPAVQDLGQVLTREGRLLVFPNCLQHQVQPFSLEDKSKSGYRKILAMFLIDPARRVLSTSNVPPQRRDWWAEEVHKEPVLKAMPPELVEHTIGFVDDFPVSWEKAVEMREKLMDERSHGNSEITANMMQETFFFCEH